MLQRDDLEKKKADLIEKIKRCEVNMQRLQQDHEQMVGAVKLLDELLTPELASE